MGKYAQPRIVNYQNIIIIMYKINIIQLKILLLHTMLYNSNITHQKPTGNSLLVS